VHQDFAIKLMIGIGLLAALLFCVLSSVEEGVAVLAGASLGLLNYRWLYQGAVYFFEAAESGGVRGGAWVFSGFLRLGFLGGVLALFTKLGLAPIGLVVGLSVPMVSQLIWTSRRAFGRSAQMQS
jgi:hypothetical protein